MTFGKPSGADLSLSSNYCGALPKVPKYRHFSNVQGGQGTIKDRLRLAWAAFTKLRGIWVAPLKPSTKLRLFDALVYPVLNFGSGALSVPLKTLRCIYVQVNVMRRTACNTGRLDEFGKCYPNCALYVDTPKFSTIHKRSRAKLVGHLLRHSTSYKELLLWNGREKSRKLSPAEECICDLGITLEEALVFSHDRVYWQNLVEGLKNQLEPTPSLVEVTSPRWKTMLNRAIRCISCYDFQLVEENSTPFPSISNEAHVYTDGSIYHEHVSSQRTGGAGIVTVGPKVAIGRQLVRCKPQTPDRAEIQTIIAAFSYLPAEANTFVFHTDSAYVWHFFHVVRHKRRIICYTDVPNGDLLQTLDYTIRSREATGSTIYLYKVRARTGNHWNETADQLAKQGSRRHIDQAAKKRKQPFTRKVPSVSAAPALLNKQAKANNARPTKPERTEEVSRSSRRKKIETSDEVRLAK